MSSLEAHIVSVVTAAIGIAVGFGIVNNEVAGIVISGSTTLLAAVFQILAYLHVKVGSK